MNLVKHADKGGATLHIDTEASTLAWDPRLSRDRRNLPRCHKWWFQKLCLEQADLPSAHQKPLWELPNSLGELQTDAVRGLV